MDLHVTVSVQKTMGLFHILRAYHSRPWWPLAKPDSLAMVHFYMHSTIHLLVIATTLIQEPQIRSLSFSEYLFMCLAPS